MDKAEKIKKILERGVKQVIVKDSLAKKLKSGKKLRIKLGVDPTAPNLHLGHTVVLRKLKQFQDLGHQAIFLVGDFTGQIGDPSDQLSKRKALTKKEIEKNMETYKNQVGKILDLKKVEIHYNTEWHINMDFAELFQLTSKFTVNQMLERDMFQERIEKKKPLWIHELLYPILQGYDSVALRADVEIGGTDQTFNMLAARTVQPYYQQPPQDIITCTLIEGTDGKEKMSMSVGNTINILDKPEDMYGKIMSLPDHIIIKYFELLTDVPEKEISEFEKAMKKGENPRDFKARLAKEIVTLYHGKLAATKAEDEFNKVFKEKKAPSKIPIFKAKKGSYRIVDILQASKLVSSKSEARRLIEQGGVSIDNKVIKDWQAKIELKDGVIVKVGKRKFAKVKI